MLVVVAPKALGSPLHVVMYGAFVVLTSVGGTACSSAGLCGYRYRDAEREDAGGGVQGWAAWRSCRARGGDNGFDVLEWPGMSQQSVANQLLGSGHAVLI